MIECIKCNDNQQWLSSRKRFSATKTAACLYFFGGPQYKYLKPFKTEDASLDMFCIKHLLTTKQRELYDTLLKVDKTAMQYGIDNEKEVAEIGKNNIENVKEMIYNGLDIYINHAESDLISATPDYYIITNDGEKHILECKTTSNLTEDLVKHYNIQVQTQLLCTGLKHAYLIICMKDNLQAFNLYEFNEDKELQADIIKAVKEANIYIENFKKLIQNRVFIKEKEQLAADIYNNNISKYLSYFVKQKENFNLKISNELAKLIINEKINCKDYNIDNEKLKIDYRIVKDCYYTIEDIQNEIKKYQDLLEQVKNGEKIKKRAGSIVINSVKYDNFR